ncbi:MAG: hypothetical protein RIQ60_2607 [Pseudomonadota bacterium]|jgi:RNA polymerase sigma factor for flagellar operon FliA
MQTHHQAGETAPVQAAAWPGQAAARPDIDPPAGPRQAAHRCMPTDADVRPFVPLVRTLARQLRARLPASVETGDLVQAGLLGLVDAFGRYDGRPGVRFTTYATRRIRGAMLDELRRVDWLSRSDRQQGRELAEARRHLLLQLHRAPTEGETAAALGLPLAELQGLQDRTGSPALVSFEDLAGPNGGDFLDHHTADTGPDLVDQVDRRRQCQAVAAAIHQLPARLQRLLSLLYADDLSTTEAAAVLGVTHSRVSQLHRQALDQVRTVLRTAPAATSTPNTERA